MVRFTGQGRQKRVLWIGTSFATCTLLIVVFQNCSQRGFSTSQSSTQPVANSLALAGSDADSSLIPSQTGAGNSKTCSLDSQIFKPGAVIAGYLNSSALFPVTCGEKVSRICLSNGEFSGSVPLAVSCSQQCLHPDTLQAVNSGSQYVYYTKNSGLNQADCDAAKVVSSCSDTTGSFTPAVAIDRFSTCLVSGQTCAYTVALGTAVPSGNQAGATVTGFKEMAATYPMKCGGQYTASCLNTGLWSAKIPVYSSCIQKCLHPDSQAPVDQDFSYSFYTLQSGTAEQCNSARVVSTCNSETGQFFPVVTAGRFLNCKILALPSIGSFSSSASSVVAGGSATLTWSTTDATSILVNGVDVTGKMSQVVYPTVNTVYNLVVSNSVGSVAAKVTVGVTTVTPTPTPGPTPTPPPLGTGNVKILFPPPSATSDSHIIVRGTTPAGQSVTSVAVNGIIASSSDGFRNWRADVPLSVGVNSLQVSLVQNGQSLANQAAVSIERFSSESSIKRGTGAWAGRSMGLSYEPIKNRIIMGDDLMDGAYEVDVATGNRRMLSSSETPRMGSGYESVQPNQMVSYQNKAYLYDNVGNGLIFSIDLENGNQSIVYQPSAGATSVCMSGDFKSLLTFGGASGSEVLSRFDLGSGATTVLASKSVGSGVDMRNGSLMTYSAMQNKAYVSVFYSDTIIAVDLNSGVRTTFSQATGSEPKVSGPQLEVHDASNRVFALDSGSLIAIDMATGRRTILANKGPLASLNSYHAFGMSPWGPLLVDYYDEYYPSNSSGSKRTPTVFVVDPIEGTRVILGR